MDEEKKVTNEKPIGPLVKHASTLIVTGLSIVALAAGGGLTYVYLGATRHQAQTDISNVTTSANQAEPPKIIERTIIKEVEKPSTAPLVPNTSTPITLPPPVIQPNAETVSPSSPLVSIASTRDAALSCVRGAKQDASSIKSRINSNISSTQLAVADANSAGQPYVAQALLIAINVFNQGLTSMNEWIVILQNFEDIVVDAPVTVESQYVARYQGPLYEIINQDCPAMSRKNYEILQNIIEMEQSVVNAVSGLYLP